MMDDTKMDDGGVPSNGQAPAPAATAGQLLRMARESRGLHIAALAASMKVTPRKLEALEADRLDELPDITFARALAQTICRSLKVDPKPVLDLLPATGAVPLSTASRVQPSTFREHSARAERSPMGRPGPLFWAALGLVAAAALVYFLPAGVFKPEVPPVVTAPLVVPPPAEAAQLQPDEAARAASSAEGPAPAASAALNSPADAPMGAASGVATSSAETVFSAPTATDDAAASVKRALVITTTDASWVEVRDAKGQALISETVTPGRTVGLDGPRPFKILIGNAAATRVTFLGRSVDVSANARENVARFELNE